LRGIEAYSVEAAGASGGVALRQGYLAIKSGVVDVALVLGVEKVTDKVVDEVDAVLAATTDSDYEAVQGLTLAAQAALLMRRYIYEFDVPREAFAGFPLIAHANGAANPNAMFRRAIKPELYARAGMVSDPLNMFDAAPDADGAAALILTRPELLPVAAADRRVRVLGSSVNVDTLALHDRPDPLDFRAAKLSVEQACYQAGIAPSQMDFFELHDAYSIYAVLSLEAAGYADSGEGWRLAQDGEISLQGSLPVATMGGLKARGNPWGATGVYQVVEAVMQLRGQAGANQIEGASRAMVQSLGGPASTAVTHVLEVM
jgi:acetyl-CoA C-acetyltransferase